MGAMEKIKEIEEEMARTQKNKATNYHLGTLKAKLARLRSELLLEQKGGGGGGGEGFDVARCVYFTARLQFAAHKKSLLIAYDK